MASMNCSPSFGQNYFVPITGEVQIYVSASVSWKTWSSGYFYLFWILL